MPASTGSIGEANSRIISEFTNAQVKAAIVAEPLSSASLWASAARTSALPARYCQGQTRLNDKNCCDGLGGDAAQPTPITYFSRWLAAGLITSLMVAQ